MRGDLSVATVCRFAPLLGTTNNCLIEAKGYTVVEIQHLPPLLLSKDIKEAIMFKHPHYEPQVSLCGSLSIKGSNRWRSGVSV